MIRTQRNDSLIVDGPLRAIETPELALGDPIDIRGPANDKEDLLQFNEDLRVRVWTHFYPVLLVSLILYIFLSILWLIYNVRSYNRQKLEYKRSLESRKVESSRRLEFYKQIPLETASPAEASEDLELVEDLSIHDYHSPISRSESVP